MFVNESEYDYPRLVPHTSVTSNGLSDFIVNRFQYAISSGREMYRMINEKLKISQQTLFNWLKIYKLPGCTHVCCWAHCRSIFVAALKDYKEMRAQEFIDLIAILYKVEVESILYNRTATFRPFTNLRKSFGGFSSEDGARTSAGYLTIIETCKLMKKAPLDFFRSFFNMIIEGRRDYENMSQALLYC